MTTVHAAALKLNRSARSFDDVTLLAEQSPAAAKSYLKDVAVHLRQFGQVGKAKAIEDLLETPNLASSMKAKEKSLEKIWPDREGGWGALQAERVQSMGWQATEENKLPNTYITGKVAIGEDGAATITTEHGAQHKLVSGGEMTDWFKGMIGDGPLTVKGKLDVNGAFKVTGFALNKDGKFNELTFGRVQVSGQRVYLQTPDGDVEVANVHLKNKLKHLHMLGIILPGEPHKVGSKQRYEKDPSEFFALGRFTDTKVKKAEGAVQGRHALCDMAYSKFNNQAFVLPRGQEGRASHQNRFWALGDFKGLREKKGENSWDGPTLSGQFVATYLSKESDDLYLPGAASDADAVQAAVLLAEANDKIKGNAKTVRH